VEVSDDVSGGGEAEQGGKPATSAPRCLLVMNPHSRNGDSHVDTLVGAIHRAGAGLIGGTPVTADALQRGLDTLRADLQPDRDRILVSGGDGTINRVLPHLCELGVPLGILPMGTANDLARTLAIPDDPEAAVAIALRGTVVRIDLGRVNGELFANVASIGLGPKVTEKLSADLKKHLGVLGYPRAVLSAYAESKPFRCRISVDGGRERRLRSLHLAVGNGRFYGGGATVFEDAAIDDQRLDLYSLSPMPLWRLMWLAPWVKLGRHRQVEDVFTEHGTTIRISTSRELSVSADGEILTQTPAHFEVLPGALAVVVPGDHRAPGLNYPGTAA
jgi:diacylglycerol kinase (ATP)